MKKFLKFILLVFLYSLIFVIANAAMPFSKGFKDLRTSEDTITILFMLINNVWTCLTLYFIISRSYIKGIKLVICAAGVVFFVQTFMTQIETLFFGNAFILTKFDIILIMLAGLLPMLIVTPLAVKLFQRKETEITTITPFGITSCMLKKILLIGIIYLAIYMIFGYFVAWQFKDLRVFYTDSAVKLSFFAQLANNMKTNPVIYPFQVFRGALFALATLPLLHFMKTKKDFIISVCLVYLCAAMILIIPNVLFPDTVRMAHFYEMASSMLLFGLISGNLLWERTS